MRLNRFLRSQWTRCLLTALLVPMLVLAGFGGVTFLAHAHDGHGSHLHAAASVDAARLAATEHLHAHSVGVTACEYPAVPASRVGHKHDLGSKSLRGSDGPVPVEAPTGLIISIPDGEQLGSRFIDWSQQLDIVKVSRDALAYSYPLPHVVYEEGSPGGPLTASARHLASFTAGQRLVRTSHALLI